MYSVKYNEVKPMCSDHPWHPKTVAAVDRGLLFRGQLCSERLLCNYGT